MEDGSDNWHPTKQYPPSAMISVSVILPLIALFATFLRFYVRLRLQPVKLGMDDWLIVGAVILCLGDGANLALAAIIGIQGHVFDGATPYRRDKVEANSDYAQVILEKPLYGMMKLSVLFFYRRIFSVKKGFRICNNIMIVFITLWTLAFFIAEFAVCGGKREAFWVKAAHGKTCEDRNWLHLAFAATDVIGDMLVVAMPFPFIRGLLNIGSREKFAVLLIFLLGALSTAASIVRLGFISQAVVNSHHPERKSARGEPPGLWSTVEAAVGCIAANLPPLGPLLRKTPSPRQLSGAFVNKYRSYSENRSGQKGSSMRLGSMDGSSRKNLSANEDLDPLEKHSRQYSIELEVRGEHARGSSEQSPV